MAKRKQPERWVSSLLSAAMAVAGTLFFFDKLPSFMHSNALSLDAVIHSAPVLLVLVAVVLVVIDADSTSGHDSYRTGEKSKERQAA
ncbi:MAG TPA: hypothetical protein VGF08_02790 [Terriglobales bacterium]|jgi:hypothetical protein